MIDNRFHDISAASTQWHLRFARAAVTITALLIASHLPAATYNAANDFSTISNPNGVWSYGSSTALGGTLALYVNNGPYPGYTAFDNWHADGYPCVTHNPQPVTVTDSIGTVRLAPGQLALHPGPNGEFSVFRFTSPTTSLFNVSGSFSSVDYWVGATTDVHILRNGISLLDGLLNGGFGPGTGPSFNLDIPLNSGDQLDFAVGWGNDSINWDSTGMDALITEVPEPNSIALVGLSGIILLLRRKK